MSTNQFSHRADFKYSYATYAQPLSNPNQATSALTGTRVMLQNAPSVRARHTPRLTVDSPNGSPSGATAYKETSVDQASRVLTPDSDDDGTVCTATVANTVAASRNGTETSSSKSAN